MDINSQEVYLNKEVDDEEEELSENIPFLDVSLVSSEEEGLEHEGGDDEDLDLVLAEVENIQQQEGISDVQAECHMEQMTETEVHLERSANSFRRCHSSSTITNRSTSAIRSRHGFREDRIRTVSRSQVESNEAQRPSIYTQKLMQSPQAIQPFRQFHDETVTASSKSIAERIEMLALPKRSKSDRKYATDDDTRHCHIRVRSRRRRDAGTETVDSNDGGGDHFVARMESMERNRQKKLAHARGENDYNVLLDKKMCPQCGMTQSYAEFRDKKKMCQSCGVMFRRDQVWSDVEQRFFTRIQSTSRTKEEQRYRADDQRENCKIQPKKSSIQKDYEKKLMKKHETRTLLDRNYCKSPQRA